MSFAISSLAFAEEEVTPVEREPAFAQVQAHATTEKAQLRQYPGGRDEQDLKVQSSLPQPPKNIDGSAVGEMTVPDDHD